MGLIAQDIGIAGLLAIVGILCFMAGFWTAIGSGALLAKGLLFIFSDRSPISHDKKDSP